MSTMAQNTSLKIIERGFKENSMHPTATTVVQWMKVQPNEFLMRLYCNGILEPLEEMLCEIELENRGIALTSHITLEA